MDNPRLARWCFGLTSATVIVGLILQLQVVLDTENGRFASTGARVFNMFCFFTVQSNVLVAITTGMLAVRLDRTSTWLRALRLTALIAITVTGIVFHLALKDLQELTGKAARADWTLHTASPILTFLGWVVFGPRRWITTRIVQLSVVGPVAWLVFTFIRGSIVEDRDGRHYYPYPFLDVVEHGYLIVIINAIIVALLFLGLAFGALAADKRLRGVHTELTVNPASAH